MNLFVYGTLKDREFIQTLLNRRLDEPSKAIFPGFTTVMSKSDILSWYRLKDVALTELSGVI